MSAIGPDRVPPLPSKKVDTQSHGLLGAKSVTHEPSDSGKVAKFFLKVGCFLLFPITVPLKLLGRATYVSSLRPATWSVGSTTVKQEVLGGKLDRLGTSILKVFAKIFDQKDLLQEIKRKEALFSIIDAANKFRPSMGTLMQENLSNLFYHARQYGAQGDINPILEKLLATPGAQDVVWDQKDSFKELLGQYYTLLEPKIIDPYGPIP